MPSILAFTFLRKVRFVPGLILATALLACKSGPPTSVDDLSPDTFTRAFTLAAVDTLPRDRNLHADHYPASNERRIDLFEPQIRDLRGGYVGVGTDQNFTFIAWAKSDYAFLMDFDEVVVTVNKIHMYFLEISPTYAEYRKLWARQSRQSSFEILKRRFEKTPDWAIVQAAFANAHRGGSDVPGRLDDLDYMAKNHALKTFSNDPAQYNYIREMVMRGRIQAVPGDLTGSKSLHEISAAARRIGIPIRVVYTSNAEEYFRYPENFRSNIADLFVDEKSTMVRTATSGTKYEFGFPPGEKFMEMPFHYNVQPVSNFQTWMKFRRYQSILTVLRGRTPISQGFSTVTKTPLDLGLKESGDIVKKPAGEW
ncbi:MAG: hypothetical protein K8S54_01880 [Spirochaetia bacterium]|nr:hypothetical protein [Spirochaetia bacterium]